jgi:hypothetical protein
MTLTRRQRRRRELARREFLDRVRSAPMLLRADAVVHDTPEGPCRAPACDRFLAYHGVGWGQVADLGDSQVLWLRRELPVRPPTGVAVVAAAELDLDALVPPAAGEPAGHSSFKHTREAAHDDFGTAYSPLSDSPDWTCVQTGGDGGQHDWFEAASGELRPIDNGGSDRWPIYRYDGWTPPSPDYSVELDVSPCRYSSIQYIEFHVAGRLLDKDNMYRLEKRHPDCSPDITLQKKVAGEWTTLASDDAAGASGLLRLEMVGTALKAFWNGSPTAVLEANDSDLPAAGHAALLGPNRTALCSAHADDFRTYTDAAGAPARLLGPLAGRRQIGPELAR